MTDIITPTLGESVTEATVGRWFKQAGEAVRQDEPLAELETDKVTLEINAPAAGVLAEILAAEGAIVAPGALLARISEGAAAPPPVAKPASAPPPSPAPQAAPQPKPAAPAMPPSPAALKTALDRGVDPASLEGSGKRGQVLKGDVLAATGAPAPARPAPVAAPVQVRPAAPVPAAPPASRGERQEERVRMSRLRQTIALRLKEAQNTAAMLTTFNEVDMSAAIGLRNRYKDLFEKKHGVKLGFMGFFVKACCRALEEIPSVNAEIDGSDIVYKRYVDLSVAVGTEKGLVTPVLRDADRLGFAQIETSIAALARQGS